ncbi:LysR family transcriptional regulator [Caldimonas brevitalea]|uniref:LysR family transcriptional regulator n=1 Tax=Caldimonas brevitalea TaxID=413882 RepID=A0A0G3BHM2_9BURK|nr:LysR family transcriptional regulator [Caldimonas brevitalea]AKJ28934.1 LysR family transcriptional regulator [Caldimonas brevitalea]
MDLRTLACFVAVVQELHFRRAAERLHITQPALSMRIRALEEDVGVRLLERDRRRVSVTAAGAVFYEHASAAVAHAQQARAEALRAARGESGRLRIGFTVIALHGSLPQAVRVYRERHPGVRVELGEMPSPAVEAALLAAEIDIGVLHPPVQAAGLVTQPLPDDPLVLALPAGHALARLKTVPLTRLAGEPLLVAPRSIGPHIHDRLMALFDSVGVRPTVVQEVSPMTSLMALVAAGLGLGFVTRSVADGGRAGVRFRDVRPQAPRLPLALAWRGPGPSLAARRFADLLDEQAREGGVPFEPVGGTR